MLRTNAPHVPSNDLARILNFVYVALIKRSLFLVPRSFPTSEGSGGEGGFSSLIITVRTVRSLDYSQRTYILYRPWLKGPAHSIYLLALVTIIFFGTILYHGEMELQNRTDGIARVISNRGTTSTYNEKLQHAVPQFTFFTIYNSWIVNRTSTCPSVKRDNTKRCFSLLASATHSIHTVPAGRSDPGVAYNHFSCTKIEPESQCTLPSLPIVNRNHRPPSSMITI